MNGQPDIIELARARRIGWEDASRGLSANDAPFEFADGPLLDAWLAGFLEYMTDARELLGSPTTPSRAPALIAVTVLSVLGAAVSITLAVPSAACAFGLLYGGYLGFHLGLCVRSL